ncbi:hypothetical protein AB0K43_15770 [Kitasatospora sp. NPDC049258]|uniref:hypothetical protein n=1 Tax=Kitasatospora sp. NPDC049258 TaxID=3155394 RepID=UPI0034407739
MSDGYRVNTDELEAVVKRLRTLQQGISECGSKAKYNTVVTRDDFGGDFQEAQAMFAAHDRMQQFLTNTIAQLDSLINEFGDKTHTVNQAYLARESDGVMVMDGHNGRAV